MTVRLFSFYEYSGEYSLNKTCTVTHGKRIINYSLKRATDQVFAITVRPVKISRGDSFGGEVELCMLHCYVISLPRFYLARQEGPQKPSPFACKCTRHVFPNVFSNVVALCAYIDRYIIQVYDTHSLTATQKKLMENLWELYGAMDAEKMDTNN